MFIGCNSVTLGTCAKGVGVSGNGGPMSCIIVNVSNMNTVSTSFASAATYKRIFGIKDNVPTQLGTAAGTYNVSDYDYIVQMQSGNIGSASMGFTYVS